MNESAVEAPIAVEPVARREIARRPGVWRNLLRYLLKRLLMLSLTVVTAVYITILIANFGGYVDEIVAGQIEESIGMSALSEPLRSMPAAQRQAVMKEAMVAAKDAAGLNDPFFLRTVRWLEDGLTLDWGLPRRWQAYFLTGRSPTVREVIVSNLARSLFVFGAANLLLFGASILLALYLNRRRGGLSDRLFILLSPLSSAPAWVYGILLTALFLQVFGFSPGGTFDSWEGGFRLSHIVILLRHLLLPFLAIFLAGLFQTVYSWRALFQVYGHEDYVEMAHARGLPAARIDRDYILRPVLPALLTRFALLITLLWQEIIALEYFFNVQGLGRLFYQALQAYDTPMIVAIVTTFAYLIAITVFLLDICYALVDPRVRVGGERRRVDRLHTAGSRWARLRSFFRLRGPKERRPPRNRFPLSLPNPTFDGVLRTAGRIAGTIGRLRRYPFAMLGLAIIMILAGVSVYTVVTIPVGEAISLWRGDDNVWDRHPRTARPAWVNLFRRDDLPPTITFDTRDENVDKQITELENGWVELSVPFTFAYNYADFPQEIVVDLEVDYVERGPHLTLAWLGPDGRERELTGFKPMPQDSYFVSRDHRLMRRLDSERPQQALFGDAQGATEEPLKGTYTLRLNALLFEPDTGVEATVTIIGQVHGLAGTDGQRRDLGIALLWGTPVALGVGLIAAVATSVGSMLIAAVGAWYGGAIDRAIQFLTEVTLILPFFPVSLMVFVMYSRSIVTILAVTVALTLFGTSVKAYRATFLQVRASPYIEAARAYGASNWRIVVRYLAPRILTVMIPRIIILVPGYVFLEATLAFLGVSDPLLPTWGKLVVSALAGVQSGSLHLVWVPLGMLFLTGLAFAMVGLALEDVFEPRQRKV